MLITGSDIEEVFCSSLSHNIDMLYGHTASNCRHPRHGARAFCMGHWLGHELPCCSLCGEHSLSLSLSLSLSPKTSPVKMEKINTSTHIKDVSYKINPNWLWKKHYKMFDKVLRLTVNVMSNSLKLYLTKRIYSPNLN